MGMLPRHLADDLQCIGTPSRPHEGELGCGQGWVDEPGAGEGWEEEAAGLVPCCPLPWHLLPVSLPVVRWISLCMVPGKIVD